MVLLSLPKNLLQPIEYLYWNLTKCHFGEIFVHYLVTGTWILIATPQNSSGILNKLPKIRLLILQMK